MPSIIALNESLEPGALVDLFILDLNSMGINQIFYFTASSQLGTSLWFAGKEYVSRVIGISGLSKSSQDAPPEPTFTIGNADKGGYALLDQYGELLGATVTRIQTREVFLDRLSDGVTPNPNADSSAMHFPEIWYIEQKENADHESIQWRLKSVMDLNGKMIPARVVLKDICLRRYRSYDVVASGFKYATVCACPYAGSTYFKRDGTTTANPALDDCTKDYKGCKLRFPNQPLPGWFFPGVSRLPRS